MTFLRIFRVVLVAVLFAAGNASVGYAQDGGGSAAGFLRELFGGKEPLRPGLGDQAKATAGERRVPSSRGQIQLSFAPLVKETAPAVVNVYAATMVQQRSSPFQGDPFFDYFFGPGFGGQPQPRMQQSLGSGVIVDPSGLIVTNNHVIGDADEIKVALADGEEFESRVVLRDERSDLAVLRIDAKRQLDYLDIEDSDAVQTGDLVLAIGNPFGVGQTVTSGIVSAVARTRVGVSDFGFFIQTDAAINPGNSGGALISMSGKLIGINSAIFSRSGGSNGIGFAVPSNMVRAVLEQARGGADAFERPYLGADYDTVTAAIAESLGMRRPAGAIVTNVEADGPAGKAGLRPGDVILAVDDHPIEHPDALNYRLETIGPGKTARFTLLSRGRQVAIDVLLEQPPQGVAADATTISGNNPLAGATVANISPRLLSRMNVRYRGDGVIITDVDRRSPAVRFDFLPGDILLRINGETITSVKDVTAIVAAGGRSWSFQINRGGRMLRRYFRG